MTDHRAIGSVWKSHRTAYRDAGWPDADCDGTLRVELDEGTAPMVVRCDGCGRTIGVRRPGTPDYVATPSAEPAQPPRRYEDEAVF